MTSEKSFVMFSTFIFHSQNTAIMRAAIQRYISHEKRANKNEYDKLPRNAVQGFTVRTKIISGRAQHLKGKFSQKASWSETEDPTEKKRTPLTVSKYLL